MKIAIAFLSLAVLCAAANAAVVETLHDARAHHVTQVRVRDAGGGPVPVPPSSLFQVVQFAAKPGALAAYLTPLPTDGAKHPAIIWLTGGDTNSIGDVWTPSPRANDQTAGAFRDAGIVTMFPSLRGGNENPGSREGFYGEVDDVLAAADYLAHQPGVDPARIYLGGHSTGGTMALLTSEYSGRFRAVFAFGPVTAVARYGSRFLPAGLTDPVELRLRSPIYWLASIASPTFVFEADGGNSADLAALSRTPHNALTHFYLIHGADHFSTLAPTTALIAAQINHDTGAKPNLVFTQSALDQPFVK